VLWLLAFVFFSHVLVAVLIWKISGTSAFFNPDTGHYVLAADSLRHGSFSINGVPEIFRTPGYPVFLVEAVASGKVVLVALLENFLFATFTAWLVWTIAANLFPGTRAAWWAVILYCFEPLGFLYSQQIVSETAFTMLLLLFVWMFLRFLESPTHGRLLLSAVVLAAATYIRPVSLYLAFVLSMVLLLFPRGLPFGKRIVRALVFPLAFLLPLAPWVARNAVMAGYPGFSSSGDWNLYFCSAAAVQAKLEGRGFAETQIAMGANNDDLYFRLHPERRVWTPGRVARAWGSEARSTIRAHWLLYLPIHAKGMAIVTLEPGASQILKLFRLYPESGGLLTRVQDEGFVRATLWLLRQYPMAMFVLPLLAAQMALYYGLALLGLRRLPSAVTATFLVMAVYLVVVSGMPAAVARYRVPLMPLVCVCAGGAIARYREKRAKARVAVAMG
jgi:4-amino-4-deoxy-L-arabinose transferase-like glycosyltransferase